MGQCNEKPLKDEDLDLSWVIEPATKENNPGVYWFDFTTNS